MSDKDGLRLRLRLRLRRPKELADEELSQILSIFAADPWGWEAASMHGALSHSHGWSAEDFEWAYRAAGWFEP